MSLRTRIWLLGTVACAVIGLSAPVAQGAFGVERFFAGNCKEAGCNASSPNSVAYTQAAGHPPFGITDFKINTVGEFPNAAPTAVVTHVRTDVGLGVSTSPEAVNKCSREEFGDKEAIPGTGFFLAPNCKTAGADNTEIGVNQVVVYLGSEPSPLGGDLPLEGKVYNLEQPPGRASDFGVALELPIPLTASIISGTPLKGTPAETEQYYAHTHIEGSVEWAGDYHDYYEIEVSPRIPLISSRLILKGDIGTTGNGGYITNPSNCGGPGPLTTNTVKLTSTGGEEVSKTYVTTLGTEGCLGESPFSPVPFEPGFKLTPGNTQSDQPDGITTEVTLPHAVSPTAIDSSQLRTGTFTLPEGMTLNPSAATGLRACSPAQIGIKTRNPVTCPSESKIGTVTLTVPQLPASEPLEGNVYLGGGEPITDPPYTIYVDAESERYGISVRLQGTVKPDETTGRLTTEFKDNPEQPFSNITLKFNGGALAPIANPLVCGPATTNVSLVPYTGTAPVSPLVDPFAVDSDGTGGACPSPLPFTLGQSAAAQPTRGAANTSFTFNLTRADGQQYLSHLSAALPLGLVGKIPAVPRCPEPQASLGTCSAESQIGTATTSVGSGRAPVQFSGPVYLTGPTEGAPFGMTTVVNAAIGPFSLGNVIVRSKIEVDPSTARVTVTSDVPTIFKGIPLRMKNLSIAVNGQGFLINPTNCGTLATNTTLTSSFGAKQAISTPFQATGCSALAFKPKFGASTNAKTSRANGASLVTKVNIPAGPAANIKSVLVTVPKQLPSRLSTLKNACLEAVFKANPSSCPANSRVGTARIKTPVLPDQLTGSAYFVSHGGAAFPDLDLVLSADGVTVILVGNTNIKNGVTTTNFASTPDVPFTGFELNLPSGPNSAVAGVGNLCKQSLVMPTTITAQNGKVIKQNTKLSVSNCPVTVVSSRAKGNKAVVTVKAPAAGRVSGGGANLKTVYKNPGKAKKVTLEVPLTTGHRPLAVRVRIGFLPKAKAASSVAHATVQFK